MYFKLKNKHTDLSLNLLILEITGLWNKNDSKVYKLYTVFLLSIMFIFVVSQFCDIVFSSADLQTVTEEIIMEMVAVNITCKSLFTLHYNNSLRLLVKFLEEFPVDTKSHHILILYNRTKAGRMITIAFTVMVAGVGVLWALLPIIKSVFSEVSLYDLPLSLWYPFDTQISPYYELVFSFEVLVTLVACGLYLANTILSITLFNHFCGPFEYLKQLLEEIKSNSNKLNENEKYNMLKILDKYCYNKKNFNQHRLMLASEEYVKTALLNCVHLHQDMLKMVEVLSDVYRFQMLVEFGELLVVLGLTGFQVAKATDNQSQVLKFLSFLSLGVMELLLYCWYGESLSLESEKIHVAAFECSSVCLTHDVRFILTMIMLRSQRPVRLPAGNAATVSLSVSNKILRNAYSFFAVLRQMNDSY